MTTWLAEAQHFNGYGWVWLPLCEPGPFEDARDAARAERARDENAETRVRLADRKVTA